MNADYHWTNGRTQRLPVTAAEAELPAVVLKDFTSIEYYLDQRARNVHVYATEHRIVRVNTSDGIERYNKIVVPLLDNGQTVDVRARTISPSGVVKEVHPADMKELKDEGGQRGFRIFAVDGVEKGSEVEYFYTRERPFNHFGAEGLQSETAAHDVTFELISPAGMTFEAKVYHGPAATADTLPGKRVLRLRLPAVPAVRDEAFASVAPHLMRVEYKLAYLANKGQVRQFTWAEASQNIFRAQTTLSKDETKAAAKILSAAKVPSGGPLPARIAALERYLKLNYNLEDGASNDLAAIAATRNATELGFTRLFITLLRRLNIEHELVITCSRASRPFDGSFDSWNYLDHFALYFPATQQYLAPGRPDHYYGMLPADWTGQKGLFVRSVKLGSIESAVGQIQDIPALPADKTSQDLDITVSFAPSLDRSTVQLRQTLAGYAATVIQPFWSLIPAAKQPEVLQEVQKGIVPDATNFQNLTVRNGERGLNPLEKPFIVEGQFESTALLDRAGPRYLFKIGTLLGPQSDLYQTEERQFDVENDNNHGYARVIRFTVPDGYTVRNLQDLNMDVKAGSEGGQPLFDFRSGYTQQGQTVTVTITENYRRLTWPKADFEAFRAVVNAAANFNKVVLVLDKKG